MVRFGAISFQIIRVPGATIDAMIIAAALLFAASFNCRETATLPVGGKPRVITLAEARGIRKTAATYLAKAKPKLDAPGDPFIDCEGVVRLGAWILEQSHSGEAELRLTYRVVWNELVIVREEMRLVPAGKGWKVAGSGQVIYHRLPERRRLGGWSRGVSPRAAGRR